MADNGSERPGSCDRQHRLHGWLGTGCLLLILVVKAVRWTDTGAVTTLVGVAPSLLGPAGLLFLLRSSAGRLGRMSLLRTTILVGAVALALEFAQLLPRPGVLARVRYTFDWLDVAATLLSTAIAYFVVRFISRPSRRS